MVADPGGEGEGAAGIASSVRRLPRRAVGAAWFWAWGTATPAVLFLDSARPHGAGAVVPFVVVPGIAAAAAGAILVPRLLGEGKATGGRGALLGAATVALAHLLFSPMFAGSLWLADRWLGDPGHVDLLGTTVATLLAGFPMTAPLTLAVGAVAGALLALLWRRAGEAGAAGP